ncbi:MAG: hypothetical protein H6625_05110 [Bdellovibrionaceae bacterium]|nr:hypothetical protein [Pseudobdellovibrionaceae bacterium]
MVSRLFFSIILGFVIGTHAGSGGLNAAEGGNRRSELVSSLSVSGSAYLAVIPDKVEGDGTQRKLGFYSREKESGDWRAVIYGEIKPSETGPIVEEFQIARTTKRFEAIAIVDETLVLFNVNSTPENEQSIAKLGQGKYKLYDHLSGTLIPLPNIKSNTDVQVYAPDMSLGLNYQLVLISVNDRGVTSTNSGYTFAFLIEVKDSSDASMNFVHPPVLLDYQFHKTQELRNLIVLNEKNQPKGVISRLYLNSISGEKKSDPQPLKQWKQNIREFINGKGSVKAPPYYDLTTNAIIIPENPSYKIYSSDSFSIKQELDIFNQDSVIIKNGSNTLKVMGRVDVDPITLDPKYFLTANDSCIFFFLNGDLYFTPMSLNVEPIKIIPFAGKIPEKISVASVHHVDGKSANLVFYAVVSFELEGKKNTTYFRITNPSETLYLQSRGLVNNIFYSSTELPLRLIKSDIDGGLTLFDYKTPQQSNEESYHQAYREKFRHFDLTHAVGNKVPSIFTIPKQEITIKERILFREYEEDEEDSKDSKSGIYLFHKDNRVSEFFPGQILPNSETKNIVWSEASIDVKSMGTYNLQTIFVDSTWEKGIKGSRQYVLVSGDKSSNFAPVRTSIKMDVPIENIILSKIIPTLKNASSFSVITIYKQENGLVSHRSDSFSLELHSDKSPKLGTISTFPFDDDESLLTEKSLIERIVYNDLGIPYWIVNPEFDMDDPRLLLKNLITQETIEPNGEKRDPSRVYKTWWDAHENPTEMRERHISEAYSIKVHKNHLRSTETMKALVDKKAAPFRTDLFPELIKLLNNLADSEQAPEHQVLVVPNDLKIHIEQLILTRFLNAQGTNETWSKRNKNMELFLFAEKKPTSQTQLTQQLRLLPEINNKQRAVLFADASKISAIGRVQDGAGQESSFLIPDSVADDSDDDDEKLTAFDENQVKMTYPHALYLLASEGKKIELADFKKRSVAPTYSQLILASEKEWSALESAVDKTEGSFGLLEHYSVSKLSPPSREDQVRMFREVLQAREFRSLDYKFDAEKIYHDNENLKSEQREEKVIAYLVTQVDALSREQKVNPLMAFSDVLVNFRKMLLYDDNIRKRRVIDYKTVQLVLAKVFKMPFKLQLLEDTDPLKILSRADILSLIQNIGGYPGDFSLTKQVVDVILRQTRQETSKAMPASIVTFGDTSTGKTQLFKSLVKTIDVMSGGNFKLYDLNKDPMDDHNMNAKAFILPAAKLTDSNSAPGLMDVDLALDHLEHFLASNNGYRGWILVDDLHYCTPKIRAKVISRIRTLFDSEDERVHVTSPFIEDMEMISFPVRNLVHFLSFNPTIDLDKIKKYVGYTSPNELPDPKKLAVASLADDGVQIDLSYFNRYSLFLNMDTFPVSSKGPGLINRINSQLRDFYSDGSFVAIAPTLIEKIVSQFKDVDARNFISGAINGIALHVQETIRQAHGAFYIVVPVNTGEGMVDKSTEYSKNDLRSESPIIDFIGKNSIVLTIDEAFEGQLHFLDLMIDSFRDQVIEGTVQAVRSNPSFSGTDNLRAYIKSYFEQAALDHIQEKSNLPLDSVMIDPSQFGIESELEIKNFESIVKDISGSSKNHFPDIFAYRMQSGNGLLSRLTNHENRSGVQDSRAIINTDYVKKVRSILLRYLEGKLHVDDINELPETSEWLQQLQEEKENEDNGKTESTQRLTPLSLGKEIAELLKSYMMDINRKDLIEKASNQDSFEKMSEYDVFRMFLFVMDKAISKLPWDKALKFLTKNISAATKSMDLGGMSGVLEYLFARDSLVRPTTGDHLIQVLLNSKDRSDLDPALVKRINTRFSNDCDRMLANQSTISKLLEGGK